ncbi:DUF421 domain-containing protein [Halalkalibacter hemicellulosilyticus]|uniref:Membrane protein of YDFR family n=1 Tax=Halalkalibacter hemicellulosilyticusJCM 9152 TaxID=1236971 RepID=W4QCV5_9BACI|nr:DUF421 domain-containing protein [Halalkalibacter hemicellulosilyticus]GAE29787.1 membrane protein of YDFR family [Halalkalibacter hemicellulosilyticusJCM 9152]
MNELSIVLIRGLVGVFFMLLLARLMGKKHIRDMTIYEYIVGISIGSLSAELTFGTEVRMLNFLLGMLIWAIIPIILSKLEMKSFRLRNLIEGKPTILIKDGRILEKNLKKESLTIDELMIHLRQKDIFHFSDIEMAVMEKNGQVSILKKTELQPLTPKDMGKVVEKEKEPRIVIVDGNLLEKSLYEYGYTKEWLLGEVVKQGAKNFSDVFLAQIDSMGNVYVDLYNETATIAQVKQKLLVAANIKQLQANLINFSLQTENKEAKEMYKKHSKQMDHLLDDMSGYLKE